MKVIRHETVRRYFNGLLGRRTQKLIAHEGDACGVNEVFAPPKRAHREENTLEAAIAVGGETRGASVMHAAAKSKTRTAPALG
jgi:hypothetical protein